jgi:hypothetical protein
LPDFINNAELTQEIIKCRTSNRISDKLARMLMLFVDRLAMKANFRSYTYRADMESTALVQLCSVGTKHNDPRPAILKFEATYCIHRAAADSLRFGKRVTPLQPNSFAYATSIVIRVH